MNLNQDESYKIGIGELPDHQCGVLLMGHKSINLNKTQTENLIEDETFQLEDQQIVCNITDLKSLKNNPRYLVLKRV